MRRKLILHGALRDLWPAGELELEAESVADAIKGMCAVTGKAFWPKPGQGRHQLRAVGFETVESLFAPTDQREIHLVPAYSGSKEGGFLQIVLGVVLVVAAVVAQQYGAAAWAVNGLFALGSATALGGLMAIISPAPQIDLSAANDPEASKYLGAQGNTVKIGTRIPLLYGEHVLYGHYISFNVDTLDVATTADGSGGTSEQASEMSPSNATFSPTSSAVSITFWPPHGLGSGPLPDVAAFTVEQAGLPQAVLSVSVDVDSGTLALQMTEGSQVTHVAYAKPADNPLKDGYGKAVASWAAFPVEIESGGAA